MAPGKQNKTAASPKDKLECLWWTLYSLDPNWEKKNITNELNFRNIHCETFESSFLKLFNCPYLERFWDSSKSIFYFIASTNASLLSSYCLCRGLFTWYFFSVNFTAVQGTFFATLAQKIAADKFDHNSSMVEKTAIARGTYGHKTSVSSHVRFNPPPPHPNTTTTHPKLEL